MWKCNCSGIITHKKETLIKVSSISLKYFYDKPVIAENAYEAGVYSELVEGFKRIFVVGFASSTEEVLANCGQMEF
ncbi:MAG: hypothetical protein DI622_06510 [Chryseobacterium sp.]|nr:MAG: hypothetical protein DI622_06510 [Chryseobacterium sp.]